MAVVYLLYKNNLAAYYCIVFKTTIISCILIISACGPIETDNQVKKVVNYQQLQTEFALREEKLLVVNFWATWCKPCVKELPHFMEVNDQFKNNSSYEMILVSLDKSESLDKEMSEVAEKLNLTTDLYLLNDITNMNTWIPAIDSSWSGAIPATVFYKDGRKVAFTEGQLSKSELTQKIKQYL